MRYALILFAAVLCAQEAPKKKRPPLPPLPGVKEVQKSMDMVKPEAVFPVPGVPDWSIATKDAVWVSNKPKGTISKLDPQTNTVTATIAVGR